MKIQKVHWVPKQASYVNTNTLDDEIFGPQIKNTSNKLFIQTKLKIIETFLYGDKRENISTKTSTICTLKKVFEKEYLEYQKHNFGRKYHIHKQNF